jgi:hypothetical protein
VNVLCLYMIGDCVVSSTGIWHKRMANLICRQKIELSISPTACSLGEAVINGITNTLKGGPIQLCNTLAIKMV